MFHVTCGGRPTPVDRRMSHAHEEGVGGCPAGMERLQVQPISRVQAIQRGGRAGRTAPGECFRLYTKRHFDHEMRDVSPPEILRTPLAAAVLHLKSLPAALGIDVLRFDFVDAPPRAALEEALRQLHLLGAIDAGACPAPLFEKPYCIWHSTPGPSCVRASCSDHLQPVLAC